jgi:pimeloyl-ACP methyl ester carboxylesterase
VRIRFSPRSPSLVATRTSTPSTARRLPNGKLDLIDAGHYTWEDAADTYAALVTSWWSGGYETGAQL